MVLVDTNIWISAFKDSASAAIPTLSKLLVEKHACMTEIIRAELLSGARNEMEYRFLESRLVAVSVIVARPGLWDMVAHARYRLARMGIQESLLDLSIACVARQYRFPLWTEDKPFAEIRKVIPFKRFTA